jgi:hypothetical protein
MATEKPTPNAAARSALVDIVDQLATVRSTVRTACDALAGGRAEQDHVAAVLHYVVDRDLSHAIECIERLTGAAPRTAARRTLPAEG